MKYRLALAELFIYRNLLDDTLIKSLVNILNLAMTDKRDSIRLMDRYGSFINVLFGSGHSFTHYLLELILYDDNPFSREAEHSSIENIDPALIAAVKHDLSCLQTIYTLDFADLVKDMGISSLAMPEAKKSRGDNNMIALLDGSLDWPSELNSLADYYFYHSRGIPAQYRALRYTPEGGLVGIKRPDLPDMNELIGCDQQKKQICANTEIFLKGYPSNNILLYGKRGTGKSSMIKSLIKKYEQQNLCIVEISRDNLKYLPELVELLGSYNLKFIVFMDDLSFEDYETEYKGLKAVLEGSLARQVPNVLLYATSNRRHLVKEFFSDRGKAGDEIHAMDTMQEKLSLADRFGLCITFDAPDQKTYLRIVEHLAGKRNLNIDLKVLKNKALEWERNHYGPSGRTARQFIDSLGEG